MRQRRESAAPWEPRARRAEAQANAWPQWRMLRGAGKRGAAPRRGRTCCLRVLHARPLRLGGAKAAKQA